LSLLLGGKGSKELVLLFGSLVTTVTELGGCVDELDLNLFGHPVAGGWEDRLTEDDCSLLGSHNLTSDKEIVLGDFTVVGETSERGDVLLNGISSGGGIVGDTADLTSTETVDLLVDLGTGVVTLLTSSGDRPFDGSGMPSTDTSNLSETSVSLSLELLGTESLNNTLVTFTLGYTNGINNFVSFEDLTN